MAGDGHQSWTLPLLTMGVLAVGGVLAWDQHRQVAGAEQKIAALKSAEAADKPRADQLLPVALKAQKARADLASLSKTLPVGFAQDELLRRIGDTLQRQGVTRQRVQVKPIVSSRVCGQVPLTVDFQGGFDALRQLLAQLDDVPRLIRVTELEVQGDPTQPAKPLSVRLELVAYFDAAGQEAP
jgi:Tfp pilus assembly protein PilO